MKKILLITFLSLMSVVLCGQAKIYTKKTKLVDFPQKTTKVVLTGDVFLDGILREEVSSCWHLSPFEFCSAADYEKIKTNNGFYFLRVVKDEDLMSFRLEKGGKEDDPNTLRRPLEVVTMAIASAEDASGEELGYISAYLDVIQHFTEGAMTSESKAYMNLLLSASGKLRGRKILTDPKECRAGFESCEAGAAVALVVAPHSGRTGAPYWLYVISCDTHELLFIRRRTISQKNPAGFSSSELSKFNAVSAK